MHARLHPKLYKSNFTRRDFYFMLQNPAFSSGEPLRNCLICNILKMVAKLSGIWQTLSLSIAPAPKIRVPFFPLKSHFLPKKSRYFFETFEYIQSRSAILPGQPPAKIRPTAPLPHIFELCQFILKLIPEQFCHLIVTRLQFTFWGNAVAKQPQCP